MSTRDVSLWQQWRSEGDADTFAEIISRHSSMVYATCKRILGNAADAEDVTQHCFMELMRARVKIRSLASWLHTMAVRRSVDLVRANARRRHREIRSFAEKEGEQDAEMNALMTSIDEAIAELPERLRGPIIARFLEGESYENIAAALGVAESTVRYRARKGIERVRKILNRRGIRVTTAGLAATLGAQMVDAAPATLTAALGKLALAGTAGAAGRVVESAVGANEVVSGQGTVPALSSGAGAIGGAAAKVKLIAVVASAVVILSVLAVLRFQEDPLSQTPAAETGALPAGGGIGGEAELVWEGSLEPFVVTGIVQDLQTGDPLPGALVTAAGREVETGTDGLYTFTGLAKGEHEVTASLVGYASHRAPLKIGDERHVRLDIAMSALLEIRCVDGGGSPVPQADVHLVEHVDHSPDGKGETAGPAEVGPIRTDEKGIAGFRGVPSVKGVQRISVYAVLPGRLAGYVEHPVADGPGRGPDERRLEVVLGDAMEVAGVVVVPDGYDPRESTVRVEDLHFQDSLSVLERRFSTDHVDHGNLWPHLFERRPDGAGRFAFEGLPSDAWVYLKASAPGLSEARTRVNRSSAPHAITMELLPEGAVEGTMVFEGSGRPAEGIGVVATSPDAGTFQAVVDGRGAFRIAGLPEGIYDLTLPHGFDRSEWTMAVRRAVRVVAGRTSTGHDLVLERGAIVSGIVADAVTGSPIPRASISAVMGPNIGNAWTDAEGRYSLRLPRGRSKLYLSSRLAGYEYPRDQASRVVIINAGESRKDGMDFALTPRRERAPEIRFGRVRGRILGPNGEALAGVPVRTFKVYDGESEIPLSFFNRSTVTDAGGQYELLALAGHEIHLRAGGNRYSTAEARFKVAADETHEVEDLIVLAGSSAIEGRVVDAEGQPLAGVHVGAISKSKRSEGEPVRTDRDGRFRLESLVPEEPLEVTLTKPGYSNRVWHGVAPDTLDLRFVMHELDGGRYRHTGDRKPRDPESLVGEQAPAWDVGEWIQEPVAPCRPDRGDGRSTLLILAGSRQDWSELGPRLQTVEEGCARRGVLPVLILRHSAHESTVRPALEVYRLRLGVAVDRFVPRSEYPTNSATGPTYGYVWRDSPFIFLIDSSGTVQGFQRGLDRLEVLLDQGARAR